MFNWTQTSDKNKNNLVMWTITLLNNSNQVPTFRFTRGVGVELHVGYYFQHKLKIG